MTPSEQIDNEIASLTDWRGPMVAQIRAIIRDVAPDITEEWKWNTPVFSKKGMVCAVGAFKDHVKINFFKGASLPDPNGLFNAGLEAKETRAIDFHSGDSINESALRELLLAAIDANTKKKA